jgi:hypothetical protein
MIFTRKNLEDMEDKILAPYGFHTKNSHGRLSQDNEPLLFADWNIKRKYSLMMKAIITVHD